MVGVFFFLFGLRDYSHNIREQVTYILYVYIMYIISIGTYFVQCVIHINIYMRCRYLHIEKKTRIKKLFIITVMFIGCTK